MKLNYIVIQTQVYLLFPVLLLLFPHMWVLSWFAAAAIHECCHLFAIRLLRIKILKLEIGLLGAKIETEPMAPFKELITALAGPFGALSTLVFSRYIPQIVLCTVVQTVYNLLPVYPLDGGRAVRCLLAPRMKGQCFVSVEKSILFSIILCCILMCIYFELGFLPVVLAVSLLMKYVNANIPCKQRR